MGSGASMGRQAYGQALPVQEGEAFMKKSFFCSVVIFFALIVFAGREARGDEDYANFVFGIGEIGVGVIGSDFDFNFKLFNLFFQHEMSPFALEIIPVTYNNSDFYDGSIVSFLNTKLYLSFLSAGLGQNTSHSKSVFIPLGFIASPFASVRALNIPNFHSYNYIIDAGFKVTVFLFDYHLMVSVLNIEFGRKYFKQNRKWESFINISSGIPLTLPAWPFFIFCN